MSMVKREYLYNLTESGNELDYLDTLIGDLTSIPTAQIYMIDAATAGRLDLISMMFFGTYHMGWLICEYNDILDPFTEIYIGREIKIPYIDEYYRFFNRNSRSV